MEKDMEDDSIWTGDMHQYSKALMNIIQVLKLY